MNVQALASAQQVAEALQYKRKLFMTAIYDHIAKAFNPPAFVINIPMARRAFGNAANDKAHPIGQNPGDYTMFVLGEWTEDTAEFTVYPQHESLGLASSYVKGA